MRPHLLRTAAEHRQDRIYSRSERAADVAESAVQRQWRRVLDVIREGGPWHIVHARALAAVRGLTEVQSELRTDLIAIAGEAARNARSAIGKLLPRDAVERLRHRRPVRESLRLREDITGDLLDWLLPTHPESVLQQVVYSSGWERRFAGLTRLAPPDVIASLVANGVQSGEHPYTIARSVLPFVDNYKVSARRTARTAGMYVAHEAELRTHEQLGDLVTAYQIHATLDSRTRPEHRRRDGTIYYRRPGAGQKGFNEMPRPPAEADGTLAFNCRCWISPILDV